jgi:hypothetical protein
MLSSAMCSIASLLAICSTFRVEAIELDQLSATFAQRCGIASQRSKCSVAYDELQIAVEYREAKAQGVETGAKERWQPTRETARCD